MNRCNLFLLCSVVVLSGCSAGMGEWLAKDKASACGYSTVTYAAGAIIPAPSVPLAGVYVHQHFCRSNTPGSVVQIKPDGTMTVIHGSAGSVVEPLNY